MKFLLMIQILTITSLKGVPFKVNLVIENKTEDTLKEPMLYLIKGTRYGNMERKIYLPTILPGKKVSKSVDIELFKMDAEIAYRILVKNGEVYPDTLKINLIFPSYASISNLIFTQVPEYEVHHTITQFEEVYPILFLHGNLGTLWYWKGVTNGYKEAMLKIKDEGYRGYEVMLNSPNIDVYYDTPLPNTYERSHPKRQIYNAQYYKNEPFDDYHIHGVIGSNGNIVPESAEAQQRYNSVASYGSYAQRVADIVNRILEATYSDKILVVAHSMGGLVIRSAIKYYGLQGKVKRLLLIGTPNHGATWEVESDLPAVEHLVVFFMSFMMKLHIANELSDYPDWMIDGEAQEVGFTVNGERLTWNWKQGNQVGTWTQFLNQGDWNSWTRTATIAGDLNPVVPSQICTGIPGLACITFLDFETSDGLVSTNDVELNSAVFNAVYHKAHGTSGEPGVDLGWLNIGKFPTWGPLSLTASEVTTEYIRTWVIDGDESRNATSITANVSLYPSPDGDPQGVWNYKTEDLWLKIDISESDWNKIIGVQVNSWISYKSPVPVCRVYNAYGMISYRDFSYRDFQSNGNIRKILLYPKNAFGDIDPTYGTCYHQFNSVVYLYSLAGKALYIQVNIDLKNE